MTQKFKFFYLWWSRKKSQQHVISSKARNLNNVTWWKQVISPCSRNDRFSEYDFLRGYHLWFFLRLKIRENRMKVAWTRTRCLSVCAVLKIFRSLQTFCLLLIRNLFKQKLIYLAVVKKLCNVHFDLYLGYFYCNLIFFQPEKIWMKPRNRNMKKKFWFSGEK